MKESIPEGKKRTNKGLAIATSSVCKETAGSRKAEKDGKRDSFGVEVLKNKGIF